MEEDGRSARVERGKGAGGGRIGREKDKVKEGGQRRTMRLQRISCI